MVSYVCLCYSVVSFAAVICQAIYQMSKLQFEFYKALVLVRKTFEITGVK